jgi:hypothetical protein
MMMISVQVSIIVFSLSLVVGCGGNNPFDRSQDPLKDYPSLKNATPEQTAPPAEPESVDPPVQQFLEDNHIVTVSGKLTDEPFRFVRGQETIYEIEVRNLVPDTVFSYDITRNVDQSSNSNEDCNSNLPCLDLLSVDGDRQTYELKWNVPQNFELDDPDYAKRIEMSFVYKEGTSQAARAVHDLVLNSREFNVEVDFSNEPVFIQGSEQLDGEQVTFNESQGRVNIDIRIVDPNGSNARKPEIQFSAVSMNVDYLAMGFLVPTSAAPQLRNGVWVQRFELNVAGLAAAYRAQNPEASGQFTSGFTARAHSTATRESSEQAWERSFFVNMSGGAN